MFDEVFPWGISGTRSSCLAPQWSLKHPYLLGGTLKSTIITNVRAPSTQRHRNVKLAVSTMFELMDRRAVEALQASGLVQRRSGRVHSLVQMTFGLKVYRYTG